jgi:hypothetical protein
VPLVAQRLAGFGQVQGLRLDPSASGTASRIRVDQVLSIRAA